MTQPIQTLIFDAYDAYLAVHQSAWGDLAEVGAIYDGPQAVIPTDTTYCVVGCDDPTQDGLVTAVDQAGSQWMSIGAKDAEESFAIWSTLVVWSGDDDFALLRAEAKRRFNSLGAALRPAPHGHGDATLNDALNAGLVGWCGPLSISRVSLKNAGSGIAMHVPYSLTCTARY